MGGRRDLPGGDQTGARWRPALNVLEGNRRSVSGITHYVRSSRPWAGAQIVGYVPALCEAGPRCSQRPRAGDQGQADDVRLRMLEPGDEETAERACRAFGADGDLDASRFLAGPGTALIVAEDGADIVGWVYGHELLHPGGERTMLLYALDVAEQRRRRGIGKALVAGFLDRARAAGCTEVWVLTNDGNAAGVATYRAAGGQRDPADQVMFTWTISGRHP